MNKLDNMRTFVEVAHQGSFVAASRTLDLSAPAVTRSVAQLEKFLGVKLFDRTTRTVTLTTIGAAYLHRVERILADIEQAEATAGGNHLDPRGTLSLTAPVLFGQKFVVPIVTDYLAEHSAVRVRVSLDDQVGNVLEDGHDIAIRIGPLRESSLYAIKVGEVQRFVCAAQEYLNRHGEPQEPGDLSQHTVVQATPVEPTNTWAFRRSGRKLPIKVSPRLVCSQNATAIQATRLGCGVTRVMSYQVADDIRAGRLKRLLTEFENEPLPIHVVHLEGRRADAKARAFIDLVVERLRPLNFQ